MNSNYDLVAIYSDGSKKYRELKNLSYKEITDNSWLLFLESIRKDNHVEEIYIQITGNKIDLYYTIFKRV